MSKIKNISQLTENLADVFEKLKENKIDIQIAREMNNTAGKMIKASLAELDQNKFLRLKKKVKFLDCGK